MGVSVGVLDAGVVSSVEAAADDDDGTDPEADEGSVSPEVVVVAVFPTVAVAAAELALDEFCL